MLLLFELGIFFRDGVFGGSHELITPYLIERLMVMLGAGPWGFIFPALTVVTILLASHLVARHPTRCDVMTLLGMALESFLRAIPLVLFNRILMQALRIHAPNIPPEFLNQIIYCVGAGIYEEFVFRLVLLAGLDILLVNVIGCNRSASRVFAVLISAALFAGQHHEMLGGKEPFDTLNFLFRTGAGVYLAMVFISRGFGITAGCHVFYNVILVTTNFSAEP